MVTVDYLTKIISVPQSFLTFVSGSIYDLDTNAFRLALADIQDSEEGIPEDTMFKHNTEVTVAGTTFARTFEIINGYSVEFEDGQYTIRLQGSNNNIFDVAAGILVQNQVQIVSANSAGLINAPTIDLIGQQVLNEVFIDPTGEAGLEQAIGNFKRPVNNLADAFTIATRDDINAYRIKGTFTLDRDYPNWTFEGWGSKTDVIINFGGFSIDDTLFENIQLLGTMTGMAEFVNCDLGAIVGFSGLARHCGLSSTIQTAVSTTLTMTECYSLVAGTGTPVLDDGNNSQLNLRSYTGGIQLDNFTAGSTGTIDLVSGHIIIDSTCTGGTLVVRGVGQLTDNSTGTTVISNGLVEGEDVSLVRKILANHMETDPVTGILTIYDDDDTVLLTAQLYEDVSQVRTYRGKGAERREKLT